MTDITEEIIEGVIGQLKTDVTAVSNRIYSFTPQKATFPYISFNWRVEHIPTKGTDFFTVYLTFSVFTQRGSVSAVTAGTRIINAIHDSIDGNNSLSLETGETCLISFDGGQVGIPEDDGKTYQITSRYKVLASH